MTKENKLETLLAMLNKAINEEEVAILHDKSPRRREFITGLMTAREMVEGLLGNDSEKRNINCILGITIICSNAIDRSTWLARHRATIQGGVK